MDDDPEPDLVEAREALDRAAAKLVDRLDPDEAEELTQARQSVERIRQRAPRRLLMAA